MSAYTKNTNYDMTDKNEGDSMGTTGKEKSGSAGNSSMIEGIEKTPENGPKKVGGFGSNKNIQALTFIEDLKNLNLA